MLKEKVEKLKNCVIEGKLETAVPIKIKNGKYLGWVSDFGFSLDGEKFFLDLNNWNDVFLLFALSIAWSKNSRWENAALFVAYLRYYSKDTPDYWLKEENVQKEIKNARKSRKEILKKVENFNYRSYPAFSKDIFPPMKTLSENWNEIKEALEHLKSLKNVKLKNAISFALKLRNIPNLAPGGKRLLVKIPLIMRELRCQEVINFPGEVCCVIDSRVKEAIKELFGSEFNALRVSPAIKRTLSEINDSSFRSVFRKSERVYSLFGDLYDIPLFLYFECKEAGLI